MVDFAKELEKVREMNKLGINELVEQAYGNARNKGFWDEVQEGAPIPVMEKLMLIVTEVAEAAEDFRASEMITHFSDQGKPLGFPTELADIVIRVGDLAGAMGIDLQHEVKLKMEYNLSRPRKHGKVC